MSVFSGGSRGIFAETVPVAMSVVSGSVVLTRLSLGFGDYCI